MREDGIHGAKETTELHAGVQGGGRGAGEEDGQERWAAGQRVGPDRDGGAGVGAAGRGRRAAEAGRSADQHRACRVDAAAPRIQDGVHGAGLSPKSCSLLCQERKMSFELVSAEEAHYPKALMCRALGLSRSAYHVFVTRKASPRALEQQRIDVGVAAVFAEHKGKYGAPRVERELRRRGCRTSRKRVARSMVRQGLAARRRRRWRTTTDSRHHEPIAPNLLQRDF